MRVLALLLAAPSVVAAQPATQNVEVDPVTCWWRTDTAVVRIGEPFHLVLTCSILETEAARAVVDRSRLASAAVQFPPYEVLSGAQSTDHVTAGRRFIQYDYTLRLIAEDAFGTDVNIPEMPIPYRIESTVERSAAIQGLEQSYTLPALPVRVASIVPAEATHIREQAAPTFGAIGSREFRGRTYRLIGLILVAIAGLILAVALVRWVRHRARGEDDVARALLSDRSVIAAVRRELRDVQEETRGAWSPDTVARALTAARVVASYLGGYAVTQREVRDAGQSGEIVVTAPLGRRRVAVAGATTARSLMAPSGPGATDVAAVDLDSALLALTAARYGRAEAAGSGLDSALQTVVRAADRLAARHTWLADLAKAIRQRLGMGRLGAWAR